MSILITQDELLGILEDPNGFIKNGDPSCVEGIKYDFRFGGRFLKAKHRRPLSIDDFPAAEVESIRVEPGETVFVLTEERIELPPNVKAELSLKRKLAHQGVLVLGGFCIDPLYNGHLMFGVYNVSSEPFPLLKGKKIIAAQFYRLAEEECGTFPTPRSIEDFPRDVIASIGNFGGVSIRALENQIQELRHTIRNLRDEFDKHEGWFRDFKESLKEIKHLLQSEIIERKEGQNEIGRALREQAENLRELNKAKQELDKLTQRHDLTLKFAMWIAGSIVVATIGYVVVQLFK